MSGNLNIIKDDFLFEKHKTKIILYLSTTNNTKGCGYLFIRLSQLFH